MFVCLYFDGCSCFYFLLQLTTWIFITTSLSILFCFLLAFLCHVHLFHCLKWSFFSFSVSVIDKSSQYGLKFEPISQIWIASWDREWKKKTKAVQSNSEWIKNRLMTTHRISQNVTMVRNLVCSVHALTNNHLNEMKEKILHMKEKRCLCIKCCRNNDY